MKISGPKTQTQKQTRRMRKLKYSLKNLFIDEKTEIIWTIFCGV